MFRAIKERVDARVRGMDRVTTRVRETAWDVCRLSRSIRRRSIGRELAAEAKLTIPRDKGFRFIDDHAFPGTAGLVRAGKDIVHRWEQDGARMKSEIVKPYFQNIMKKEDLTDYPAIVAYALGRPLLATLSDYYGRVPELCSIGLMLSPYDATGNFIGSQNAHFDAGDSHNVKVVVAVEDVQRNQGPLEFLPADLSAELSLRLGSRWRMSGKYKDDRLFQLIKPEQLISADVPEGHGVILDTSNCLHFGSRVKQGRRLMWFIHFATYSDYEKIAVTASASVLFRTLDFRSRFASDEPTRLALSV